VVERGEETRNGPAPPDNRGDMHNRGHEDIPDFNDFTNIGTMEMRRQLRMKLLRGYERFIIPDDVRCRVGMTLIDMDLCEEKEILRTDVLMRLMWRDRRLTWDRKAVHIDLMHFDLDDIWRPDIVPYNSIHMNEMMNCEKTMVIVYATGHVLFTPPCSLKTHCNITTNRNDDQKCVLKFGSLVYDTNIMDLELFDDKHKGVNTEFLRNRKFNVKNVNVDRHEIKIRGTDRTFQEVTFNFVLKKVDRMRMCSA
jgi:hypothetical protein